MKRNKSSSGNNRGTKIKVMVRRGKNKKTQSARNGFQNVHPLASPPLQNNLLAAPASPPPSPCPSGHLFLCPPGHFGTDRPRWTRCQTECIQTAWRRYLVPSVVKLPSVQSQTCRTSTRVKSNVKSARENVSLHPFLLLSVQGRASDSMFLKRSAREKERLRQNAYGRQNKRKM